MARSIRIESMGGGTRGVGGGASGRARANSAAAARAVGKSKTKTQSKSVQVVPASKGAGNKNMVETWRVSDAKSGIAAKQSAASVNTGKAKTTIKINSGNTTKTPSTKKKTPSYWQLKNQPGLVKINSGKGNSKVHPVIYRRKAK